VRVLLKVMATGTQGGRGVERLRSPSACKCRFRAAVPGATMCRCGRADDPLGLSWVLMTAAAVLPLCYCSVMAVRKKRSISMPPDLDAEIAAAAARAGMSYSAWLADTARKEFTIRAGLGAVRQFERDHGAFTPEELSAAEQWAATAVERARRTGSSTRRRTA
jgi:hypothetical protein